MRERWFGATGRQVPEIALEGDFDAAEALVLDAIDDEARCARRTRKVGPSSSARTTAEDVQARARPARGGVRLVDDATLLDLDLTELTYG